LQRQKKYVSSSGKSAFREFRKLRYIRIENQYRFMIGFPWKIQAKKMGLQMQARNIVGGVSNNREETPY